ncbi:MAG: DUF4838 domain-containing protein [Clostridia bacterium]|nr:DUF4838 domain-containing protein [Clostridia bacterium]
MKKKLSILLAALLLASTLAACGKKSEDSSSSALGSSEITSSSEAEDNSSSEESSEESSELEGNSSSEESSEEREYVEGGTITDEGEHYVSEEKLLHRKTVTETNRPFATNGQTEYIIVLGTDDARAINAASFLASQIGLCNGAKPNLYIDADQDLMLDDTTLANRALAYTSTTKYIVFAHERLEQEANIEWATDVDLGYSGYMIKTVGDSVFMKVNSFYGYQTVAQSFCREVLGYEWYSADMQIYTKDGSTLPDMDIVEKPDFDLSWNSGYLSNSDYMASPVTVEDVFTTINGNFCHNSLDFLPVAEHSEAHPDWYAWEAATPINQLCYSAHGNKAEYDLMLQAAFEAVMKNIAANPDDAVLTFTRQDGYGHCICDTCNKISKVFHDSHAVMYMFFVNDLDTLVQAELQRQAEENGTPKRELTILFFAYSGTAAAPVAGTEMDNYVVPSTQVEEKEDGTKVNVIEYEGKSIELPYVKTYENGLECNENVGVFYAPIEASFQDSFYHPQNRQYKTTFEKWSLLSDTLYCWIYDTNFTQYLVPYNSYDGIPDTLRFLKDIGGEFVFHQGDRQNEVYAGFGALRTYLSYTLMRDVNLDAGVLVNKFFENYFGPAAEPMREYYEIMVAHIEQLQVLYPEVFYTQRRTNTMDKLYWPWATMQTWLKLCDDAFYAIEKYKETDETLYNKLYEHILTETIFPRFVICQFYDSYYTEIAIQEMRASFVADCKEMGYRYYAEGVSINPYFAAWGF